MAGRTKLALHEVKRDSAETQSSTDMPERQPAAVEDHRAVSIDEARELDAGARHYRAYVGSAKAYDVTAASQFALMVTLGLREDHTLLDIGCGSLCGGRLFIPYLRTGNYYGLEPESWLIDDAVSFELGEELIRLKRPSFRHTADFSLTGFGVAFDFMLAQSVLTHTSQSQLDRCLSEARLALKPEGLFAASFFSNGRDVYDGSDWIYPAFAPYSVRFVVEKGRQHGLAAYPLIWKNGYEHYWVVFAHNEQTERFSWLANICGEQRMLRVLELSKDLNDTRRKYLKIKHELKKARQELATLRGDERNRSPERASERQSDDDAG